jgi:hypothetical protein
MYGLRECAERKLLMLWIHLHPDTNALSVFFFGTIPTWFSVTLLTRGYFTLVQQHHVQQQCSHLVRAKPAFVPWFGTKACGLMIRV